MENEPTPTKDEIFIEVLNPEGEVIFSNKPMDRYIRDTHRMMCETKDRVKDIDRRVCSLEWIIFLGVIFLFCLLMVVIP